MSCMRWKVWAKYSNSSGIFNSQHWRSENAGILRRLPHLPASYTPFTEKTVQSLMAIQPNGQREVKSGKHSVGYTQFLAPSLSPPAFFPAHLLNFDEFFAAQFNCMNWLIIFVYYVFALNFVWLIKNWHSMSAHAENIHIGLYPDHYCCWCHRIHIHSFESSTFFCHLCRFVECIYTVFASSSFAVATLCV